MDETKATWFSWLANHIVYVFWTIWGAGFGATAAVLSGAATVEGDVLRIYLAILTAMMGGVLGLVANRAMDRLGDRRKVRRGIYSARLRMRSILAEWRQFLKFIDQLPPGTSTLDANQVSQCLVLTDRIARVAKVHPDFDELLDSSLDLAHAESVLLQYRFAEMLYQHDLVHSTDVKARLNTANGFATRPRSRPVTVDAITDIEQAEAHFGKRVDVVQ